MKWRRGVLGESRLRKVKLNVWWKTNAPKVKEFLFRYKSSVNMERTARAAMSAHMRHLLSKQRHSHLPEKWPVKRACSRAQQPRVTTAKSKGNKHKQHRLHLNNVTTAFYKFWLKQTQRTERLSNISSSQCNNSSVFDINMTNSKCPRLSCVIFLLFSSVHICLNTVLLLMKVCLMLTFVLVFHIWTVVTAMMSWMSLNCFLHESKQNRAEVYIQSESQSIEFIPDFFWATAV